MKVVGVVPSTTSLVIVAIETADSGVIVQFKDEWSMAGSNRPLWYSEVRTRLIERIRNVAPNCIVISPTEPMALRRGVRLASFETAELRGVVAEAGHAAGAAVEMRAQAEVTRSLNPPRRKGGPKSRPASEFGTDDAFWQAVLTAKLEKKYRHAALLAISRARGT